MQILRATSDHTVRLDGRAYRVTPPPVCTALTILSLADEAAAGSGEAYDLFRQTARTWLPRRVYRRLFPPRWMYWRPFAAPLSVAYTTRIAALGGQEDAPAGDPETGEPLKPEEAIRRFKEAPWHVHVAEVSSQLATSPDRVLDMPWPLFQLMLRASDAMRARWELSYMTAKSLPYIEKETERDKAYAALQQRAGLCETREKTVEEKRAEQRKVFERLRTTMNHTA